MARLFGVRLVVILGFALAVVLVQIIAVSRLGSYSQEFFKEEEHKLHVLSRRPTTSLEHVSITSSLCRRNPLYTCVLVGKACSEGYG